MKTARVEGFLGMYRGRLTRRPGEAWLGPAEDRGCGTECRTLGISVLSTQGIPGWAWAAG